MAGRRHLAVLAALALAAVALGAAGVALVTAQAPEITAAYVEGAIPLDPTDGFWAQAEKTDVPVVAQLLAYPMSQVTDARSLRVAAAVNATHLAIYIEWDDPTMDAPVPGGLDVFPDKVAVQMPLDPGELPYVCMGTTEQPVSIVLWQAPDKAEALIAGSGYGRDAAEREALGLHSKPTSPVERAPEDAQVWRASAVYEGGKWRVVLYRPLSAASSAVTHLAPGASVSVAFAVWQGSNNETGGMKHTSSWYTLKLAAPEAPAPPAAETVTVTETTTETVTTTETTTETVTVGAARNFALGFLAAAALYTVALVVYNFVIKRR